MALQRPFVVPVGYLLGKPSEIYKLAGLRSFGGQSASIVTVVKKTVISKKVINVPNTKY